MNRRLHPFEPSAEALVFMQDIRADLAATVLRNPECSAVHMLAIAAQLVGSLIALQDQTKVTPEEAMEIVARNIEIGNAEAIRSIVATPAQGEA